MSQGQQHATTLTPIFYDKYGGRRWRFIQTGTFVTVVIAVALLAALVRNALNSPFHHSTPATAIAPPALSQLKAREMPVFGEGVYQRIVKLERGRTRAVAADLFTGEIVHWLSPRELRAVGGAQYAFERYGTLRRKQLALTFDDGPDRTWTPKILDLLARYKIQASFFLIGREIAKDPGMVQRMVREGHVLGNHTLTHTKPWPPGATRTRIELSLSDHIIRGGMHIATRLFRNPYSGNDRRTVRANLTSIYTAQRLGYQTLAFDIDTDDWKFETQHVKPKPLDLHDGRGHVVVLHDGGGDRALTYKYLERIIKQAKRRGYVFTTPRWVADDAANVYRPVNPSVTDRATFLVARGMFKWVDYTLALLFFLGVASMFGMSIVNICIASAHERRRRRESVPKQAGAVTVAVAAYNEEQVIEQTVRSVLQSTGVDLELVVVNDGSTDGTREILERLSRRDRRLRVLNIPNGGKGNALNLAFQKARSERVVTFDADTIVPPDTVARLVRHLRQPRVAGVAGLVKVGNIKGVLTAWQSLEYISSIGVERTAQGVLGTITVVPGACAAWRRSQVLGVGGFTTDTLAEDCDLALKLQRAGCKIVQDNTAVAFTEAPQGLRALLKQRFRWSFGNLQSLWKHRSMMFRWRHGLLGMFVLPYTFVSLALPIIALPLLYTALVSSAVGGGGLIIAIFAAVFTLGQGVICFFGLLITRSRLRHLLIVPLFRVISEPLRIYLLYKTLFAALKGREHGWNKVARTGTVEAPVVFVDTADAIDPLAASPAAYVPATPVVAERT